MSNSFPSLEPKQRATILGLGCSKKMGVEDTEPGEKVRHFLNMANVSANDVILGTDESKNFD